MRVFVTGVDGYIGAVLAPYLLKRGMGVVGLDTGYYRDGWLYSDNQLLAATPHTLNKDLRALTAADLERIALDESAVKVSSRDLGMAMAGKRTPAWMARLVARWRESGESRSSLARRHHVPVWTFLYWCRRPRSR